MLFQDTACYINQHLNLSPVENPNVAEGRNIMQKKLLNGYTVAKLAAGFVLVALSVRAQDAVTTVPAADATTPAVTAPAATTEVKAPAPKDATATTTKETGAKKEELTLPERRYTVNRDPVRQLGRGLANVITGVGEIPLNMYQVNKSDGDIAALTYGLVRGIWRCVVRETVGVFEIITFPVGWAPIIEPEFIFEPMSNDEWRTNHLHFTGE